MADEKHDPTLPLHLIGHDDEGRPRPVRRRPGRPRVVRPKPESDENLWLEARSKRRADHVERDRLVGIVRDEAPSVDVLQEIKHALAVETAAIRWEIEHGRSEGRAYEQMISRRIDGLTKLAAIELGLRRLGVTTCDPHSARMQSVFRLFVETLADVATQVLDDPKSFVETCKVRFDGWEDLVDG